MPHTKRKPRGFLHLQFPDFTEILSLSKNSVTDSVTGSCAILMSSNAVTTVDSCVAAAVQNCHEARVREHQSRQCPYGAHEYLTCTDLRRFVGPMRLRAGSVSPKFAGLRQYLATRAVCGPRTRLISVSEAEQPTIAERTALAEALVPSIPEPTFPIGSPRLPEPVFPTLPQRN